MVVLSDSALDIWKDASFLIHLTNVINLLAMDIFFFSECNLNFERELTNILVKSNQ